MTQSSTSVRPRTASGPVAATPADRDRWVDALRVGSLFVVVLGIGVGLLASTARRGQAADQSAPAAVRRAATAD